MRLEEMTFGGATVIKLRLTRTEQSVAQDLHATIQPIFFASTLFVLRRGHSR
jgi:hypothetical protein